MEVRAHQAVGATVPLVAVHNRVQLREQAPAVSRLPEDTFSVNRQSGDVMSGIGNVDPQRSGHTAKLARARPNELSGARIVANSSHLDPKGRGQTLAVRDVALTG